MRILYILAAICMILLILWIGVIIARYDTFSTDTIELLQQRQDVNTIISPDDRRVTRIHLHNPTDTVHLQIIIKR